MSTPILAWRKKLNTYVLISDGAHLNVNLLKGLTGEGSGGNFHVFANAIHAPLVISFPVSPVNSLLRLDAEVIHGPGVSVKLPAAYEGTFWLESDKETNVIFRELEDPAEMGRRRNVKVLSRGSDVLFGVVFWGAFDDDKSMGWVGMRAVQSNVQLII
jgi:hypothetical protein